MWEQLHQKVERIVHRFGFGGIRVGNGGTGQVNLPRTDLQCGGSMIYQTLGPPSWRTDGSCEHFDETPRLGLANLMMN